MSTVISVEHLSKSYRLGTIGGATLKEDFGRWWARLRGQPDPLLKIGQDHPVRKVGEQFWALSDVSFQVKAGEVLGIVGRNGAGKSTLLKILSQVTAPTSGEIKVKGRIASLLEVGTGFHQELTGRENIFLNGAILGMTQGDIRRKLDEIIAFSEIEEFIDTPVKRYSSGMYVRLAFAVAAHLEPEILIVDEVLAVGDAAFQQKCLGKMEQVSRSEHRTVLFVSHNLASVRALCSKAILLKDGRLEADGKVEPVLAVYHDPSKRHQIELLSPFKSDILEIVSIKLQSDTDPHIHVDSRLQIEVVVFWKNPQSGVACELFFHTADRAPTFSAFSAQISAANGIQKFTCEIPKGSFNNGHYTVDVGISKNYLTWMFPVQETLRFEVENRIEGMGVPSDWPGVFRPLCAWDVVQG